VEDVTHPQLGGPDLGSRRAALVSCCLSLVALSSRQANVIFSRRARSWLGLAPHVFT
jgi:hypothetical protein